MTLASMTSLLLLLATPATAADDSTQILEDIFTAQHECDAMMSALDAAVDANPTWAKPRLERAECLYRVGRYEWVQRDLDVVFSGHSLQRIISSASAGGASLEEARSVVENGTVLRVIMLLDVGSSGSAQTLYREAVGVFGDSPAMTRASIMLTASSGDYASAWRMVDEALARWPSEPQIHQATREMASRDPRGVTDAANSALNAPADAVGWYNDAITAYNQGDYSDCLSRVDVALAEPSTDQDLFLRLGYSCAVSSGDLKRTNQLIVKLGGTSGLRPDAVLRHAELLYKAGKNDAALELLRNIQPEDLQQLSDVDTLQVRALTRKGDLDGALAVGLAGHARANSLANLGLALKNAERPDDAKAILTLACPSMQGGDATRCYDLLGSL